ncbi:MAG: iron ABC transporter permease [Desulfovibrionaceae bacterium]|nr:iron ABC transporter permease [Desulfovibrionaceae bacterium]
MSQKRLPALAAACLLLTCLSAFGGMNFIQPSALLEWGSPDAEVFWRARLPRVWAAFLAGAGLSMAGLVFQGMFRNVLASPFTLGVSSGASLGAACFFGLGGLGGGAAAGGLWAGLGGMGSAFAGALFSMLLVYLITRARGGFSASVMLLAGVIINFFFSSLVMFIQYLSAFYDSLRIMHWLMGSLAGLDLLRLPELTFAVLGCGLFLRRMTPELDLLLAGEELAASRGLEVRRAKLHLFVISSLLVGAIVSVTGPIGFVGMMVPHFCRLLLGSGASHRVLLPAAFWVGGCFLALCDLAARGLLAPAELPIGIMTALSGAPFFLWVLFRGSRRGEFF